MAETTRSSKPIFSRAANSKSVKDYLAQLDELTRRNKGGFSAVAEETGSSIPFMLPGRAVKSGVPEMPSRQVAQLPTPEEYQIPPQEQLPEGQVQGAQTQGTSLSDFINQLNQNLGSTDSLYLSPTGQSADGGAILSDGSTVYADGSVVTKDGQQVFATGSLPGGGLLFSDGSKKFFDSSLAGIQGFTEGIFGQILDVTQPYGVYNPIEPSPGNINTGTDLRTKNLQSKAFSLPVETQVLEVLQDDGTRFGDKSGHKGYGNSVLLQLPTGEVVRLSHLSDIGDFQVGASIPAGTYVGTTGQTGNTYGEHLDVEYYNQDGQLSDLSTFSGFSQPEQLKQFIAPATQTSSEPQPMYQSTPQPQQTTASGMTKLQEAAKALGYSPDSSTYTPKQRSDVALTSMGFNPQGTIGAQELLAGDFPAAGREISQTIERVNPTPRIDLGVSELLRGDVEGAKQQFGSTIQRAGNRIAQLPQQIKEAVVNPAYAGEGDQKPNQTLGENLQYMGNKVGEYVGAKAGEGIDKLKSIFSKGGSGVNLFSRPAMASMGQQRAVGEQGSSSSLLPGGFSDARSQQMASAPNDIRDPFFKTGMNEKYGVKDTAGGALSLDMFGSEFFQNPDNIQSVFKGTQFEAPATQKYQAYVEEQRRIEEARRQAEQNGGGNNNQTNGSQNYATPNYNNSQQQQSYQAPGGVSQGIARSNKPLSTTINNTPVNFDFGTRSESSAQAKPQQAPQQNIFQKAGSAVSNLFKKWFQ